MTIKLNFPEFLYGCLHTIQRKTLDEAGYWAMHYQKQGTFPIPAVLANVSEKSLVWINNNTDLNQTIPEWRLYAIDNLLSNMLQALQRNKYPKIISDFESFMLAFSWGALYSATGHHRPNSIKVVSRRIAAVLDFWEPLSILQYVDRELSPVGLSEVILNHFGFTMEMWGEGVDEDIRSSLRRVGDTMQHASSDQVRKRVIAALMRNSAGNPKIKHPKLLQDPEWLSVALDALEPDDFDNLTTGYLPALMRELYIMDDNAEF